MNFHKIILLFSISVTFFSPRMWAQKKNSPFRPELNYTGDFFGNFAGGIKTGYTYLGMLDAGFNFSLTKPVGGKTGRSILLLRIRMAGCPVELTPAICKCFQISRMVITPIFLNAGTARKSDIWYYWQVCMI